MNLNYTTRRIHRYFGLVIGIQLFLWTLGGIYFSWNNMDDVHGETLLTQEIDYVEDIDLSKVHIGIERLRTEMFFDSIHSLNLFEILGEPVVQFRYFVEGGILNQLIVANSGDLRPELTGQECLKIVENHLLEPIPIKKATYYGMHTVEKDHEYRAKPLPAFGFELDHPTETVVYVSTQTGQITSVRNNNWRRFDFLWMLHTMDYDTRDHITNWTLRVLSVLSLLTLLSGFLLFGITSPTLRKLGKTGKK